MNFKNVSRCSACSKIVPSSEKCFGVTTSEQKVEVLSHSPIVCEIWGRMIVYTTLSQLVGTADTFRADHKVSVTVQVDQTS